jgi:hypothetical protein
MGLLFGALVFSSDFATKQVYCTIANRNEEGSDQGMNGVRNLSTAPLGFGFSAGGNIFGHYGLHSSYKLASYGCDGSSSVYTLLDTSVYSPYIKPDGV